MEDSYVQRGECIIGYFEMAQMLISQLGLNTEEARANSHEVLCRACSRGHLGIAQWLVERFDPTKVCGWKRESVKVAYARGRIDIAQWLVDHFDITDEDVYPELRPAAGPLVKSAAKLN